MKVKKILTIMVVCFSGQIFWPAPAQAALITIEIEAVVDSVEDRGPGDGYLEGKIKAGDMIRGFYVYESTTPDSSPLDPVQGNYWNYALPAGIALTVGGFNFMTDPFNIVFHVAIRNNIPPGGEDGYAIVSYNNLPLFNAAPVDYISWQLEDPTGSALSTDALPATGPVLYDWGPVYCLRLEADRAYIINATVTSAVVIPEPASVLLFALGGFLLRKRR